VLSTLFEGELTPAGRPRTGGESRSLWRGVDTATRMLERDDGAADR